MPSISYYVNLLVAEANKDTPAFKTKLEIRVREIALELLEAGGGRFEKLKLTQTIDITTTDRKYKLNSDFNKIRKTFNAVDSNGNFVANIYCLSKRAVQRRLMDNSPLGNICYTEYDGTGDDGPGYYLVLPALSTVTRTFEFDYYRKYTSDDVEVIDSEVMVKRGVRMGMPSIFKDEARNDGYIYVRRLKTFGEDPEDLMTDIILVPDPQTVKRYRLNHNIGGGG